MKREENRATPFLVFLALTEIIILWYTLSFLSRIHKMAAIFRSNERKDFGTCHEGATPFNSLWFSHFHVKNLIILMVLQNGSVPNSHSVYFGGFPRQLRGETFRWPSVKRCLGFGQNRYELARFHVPSCDIKLDNVSSILYETLERIRGLCCKLWAIENGKNFAYSWETSRAWRDVCCNVT